MKKGQYNADLITRRLKLLVFVFVPLFLFYVGLSMYISATLKQQTTQYLVNTVELYNREIDNTIARINRRMGQMLVGSSEESKTLANVCRTLFTSSNDVEKLGAVKAMQGLFYELSMEYGESYNFFLYLPDTGNFVRGSVNTQPQRIYQAFSDAVIGLIHSDAVLLDSGRQVWTAFSVEEMGSCIMKLYRRDDIYLGCWILAEDLIAPLERMDFGQRGFVVLTDQNDTYLTGQAKAEEYGLRLQRLDAPQYRVDTGFWSNHLVIERAFDNAPFRVKLLVSEYDAFDKSLLFQIVLLLLAFGMFVALLVSSHILSRQVLWPVRRFSQNLEKLKSGLAYDSLSPNELAELEQVNDEFRRLFQKVQGLEVELYQRELEKRNVMLNYLKLQVQPHFYLNCLNFIYNMVDLGDGENAKKMSLFTADYLRYLFKNGMDRVTVQEELRHVENYLSIMKLRYRTAIDFCIEQDDSTRDATVPPMIIQTFVENAVKHATDLDRRVSISVAVFADTLEDEDRLVIVVSDNGAGFPQPVLDSLRGGTGTAAPSPASGVGIVNSLERLEYYYGGDARAEFDNNQGHGAIVQLNLPFSPPQQ